MSLARYDPAASGVFSGTIKDAAGVAIPLANMSAMTLTLTDSASGTFVNSRNAQNVLNSNNCAYNATTGAFQWFVQNADTTMVNPLLASEEHVAQINWTYVSGTEGPGNRYGSASHRLRIINYLPLCATEDVRIYAGTLPDQDLPFVEMLIEQISTRAENDTLRLFRKYTVANPMVEYFSPKEQTYHIRLQRYPIDSVVSLLEAIDGDFTSSATITVPATDYGFIIGEGLVKMRYRSFIAGEQSIKVTYTGGLAKELGAVPMDLRFACCRQVAFWLSRRNQIGVDAITVARGGKESMPKSMDLLPDVRAVFANYTPIYA